MKKTLRLLISLAVLAGSSFFALRFRDHWSLEPWASDLALEYPSYASVDGQGLIAVDDSLKRVVAIDSEGMVTAILRGGERDEGRFFFAQEVVRAVDGSFYLLNRIPDTEGFYTTAEQILHFDAQGNFLEKVYERLYPEEELAPTLVQRGRHNGLALSGTELKVYESDPSGLKKVTIPLETLQAFVQDIPSTDNADYLFSSVGDGPGGVPLVVNKRGRIETSGPEPKVWWDFAGFLPERRMPWHALYSAAGIFFSDLETSALYRLDLQGNETLFYQSEETLYNFTLSDTGYPVIIEERGVVVLSPDATEAAVLTGGTLPFWRQLLAFTIWAAALLALLSLAYAVRWIFKEVLKGHIPESMKRGISIVVVATLVSGLVAFIILGNLTQRLQNEVLNKIEQLTYLLPQVIDPDDFSAVDSPRDFLGPEYQRMRERLIGSLYQEGLDNEGTYFALHRVRDGEIRTMMYLNGDPSIDYPIYYLNDPEDIFVTALEDKVTVSFSVDAWGSWMYSTGPIKDEAGNVIGVLEMGGDFYSITQENNRLIQELLINVITAIVALVLLFTEMWFFSDLLAARSLQDRLAENAVQLRRQGEGFNSSFMTRPVAVVFFIASSMSLLFMPLVPPTFTEGAAFLGLPMEVIQSLPVSARLLFFGIGAVFAGTQTARWGWRPLGFLGVVLSALGLLVSAVSDGNTIFLIGSSMVGLGSGILMIALRSIVNQETTAVKRGESFSHFYAGITSGMNLGVLLGSWLADYIGFQGVFWVSLVLTILSAFVIFGLIEAPNISPRVEKREIGVGAFFANPSILGFFLLIVVPVYLASMFLNFFVPVFSAEQSISNADMGRFFLLNGLLIVYLGPAISKWTLKRFKGGTVLVISTVLWALSLVPFILTGSVEGMVLTVVLMGLAEGLGVTAHNEYFLALPASKKIGEDEATSYMEVVGKFGETVAPLLMGVALLVGAQFGMLVISLSLVAALVLYMLLQMRKGKVP